MRPRGGSGPARLRPRSRCRPLRSGVSRDQWPPGFRLAGPAFSLYRPPSTVPPSASSLPLDHRRTTSRLEMVKIYKPGKVAVVLSGRHAGKKVVVVKQSDEGTKERPYPHAVVAGIERYPRRVTRGMGPKKIAKRSKVKPFIRIINYNHMMPTRYALELEGLKGLISYETFKEPSQREETKKVVKKLFEEKYQGGKSKWFFTALRMQFSTIHYSPSLLGLSQLYRSGLPSMSGDGLAA
ncbi:hypothetical protein PCANC_05755 [Puccinia coronata f. sp. avenae]|uniref:60S ribosomal protein L27 n=1 Tax=Puccinia coronata f. sp. avenae TaxID=200324 RepID=A0A2N5VSK3_9BASI|nr:hypothetical protein PCANC_05755 [Puccinia coronata f. sp. avenae]